MNNFSKGDRVIFLGPPEGKTSHDVPAGARGTIVQWRNLMRHPDTNALFVKYDDYTNEKDPILGAWSVSPDLIMELKDLSPEELEAGIMKLKGLVQ